MTTEIRPPAAHQKPSGRMYRAAPQDNIVSGAWTLVGLDAISAGFTDGIEDVVTRRITPGVAGFYIVTGQVCFDDVVADRLYEVGLKINGATFIAVAMLHAAIADYLSVNCTDLLYLSATDYVELMARHVAGVDTVDIWRGTYNTFLCVQRVR